MNSKQLLVVRISRRLLWFLAILLAILTGLVCLSVIDKSDGVPVYPFIPFLVGAFGGFVGIQKRLKELPEEDLQLLANSVIYTVLSPVVGGILAMVLYMLFVGKLVSGGLFPEFELDTLVGGTSDPLLFQFRKILHTHTSVEGDAKLVVWSFIAGYSEKFVVNILGRLERDTDKDAKNSADESNPPAA